MGPAKKHMLPLFLVILSLSVFALHFLFTETMRSKPETRTTFLKNPEKIPPFTFLIKVLTYNRLRSLSRCLRSLAAADYGGSEGRVHLHIYIDHFTLARNRTDVPESLSSAREILEFVDGFEWKFGGKFVHYRIDNAGLQAQWLEAWWPSSDHEFAFVVEDDLELSPVYYKFLENLIRSYYFDDSNSSPSIYGASLQRPRFVPGKHGNKLHLDPGTKLFLYQLVGTWGQLLFPRPWKEFRLWYDDHKAKDIKPILDGMVTTGWYKRIGEKIWTPWFIKFIHSRGYYNIYTNFQHERSLSVSHRDAGVNYRKTAGPDSQLLDKMSIDSDFLKMQPLNTLKWYDFCFSQVDPGRVVRRMDELGAILPSVQRDATVLLVNLLDASESVTRNLLCNFERVNIQNYIIFGPSEFLLYDLARRGYPVIDSDQFLNNLRAYKAMKNQNPRSNSEKQILVEAYAIKKCLESGYSSWVVKSNVLFMEQSLHFDSIGSSGDFYAAESSELFFVRHSFAAEKFWVNEFLHNLPTIIDKVSSPEERRNLAQDVAKILEQKGGKMKNIDDTSLAMNIDPNKLNQSWTAGRKLVYWSAQTSSDFIKKQLKGLDLWLIDDELSCKAVICHQS